MFVVSESTFYCRLQIMQGKNKGGSFSPPVFDVSPTAAVKTLSDVQYFNPPSEQSLALHEESIGFHHR